MRLPDEDAARLVNEGFAILIQDTEGEDENVLPEGLPARAILASNGFTSVEQILAARETLEAIEGVGVKTVEKIISFCEEYEG